MAIVVSLEEEQRILKEIDDALSDLSPLFTDVRDVFLIPNIDNIFNTDGLGTWDPTSRPNPILRDTLALYNSLTNANDPNMDFTAAHNSFSFGSHLFYHELHEGGWDEFNVPFPPRPIIGLLDENDPEIGDIIQNFTDDIVQKAFTGYV